MMRNLDTRTRFLLDTCLEQINQIRTCLLIGEGKLKELPKSVPGDTEHCVIAKALSNGWKAEVDDQIVLTHENGADKEINFDVLVKSLEEKGFYIECWEGPFTDSYRYTYPGYIEIRLTPEFEELIERFDNNEFSWLILEKD